MMRVRYEVSGHIYAFIFPWAFTSTLKGHATIVVLCMSPHLLLLPLLPLLPLQPLLPDPSLCLAVATLDWWSHVHTSVISGPE